MTDNEILLTETFSKRVDISNGEVGIKLTLRKQNKLFYRKIQILFVPAKKIE